MLKLFFVCLVVFMFCFLVYDNHCLKRSFYHKETQVCTIFADDVLARAEEALQCTSIFLRYRKLREAHASLDTMATLVGGYERLGSLVDLDVIELDAHMHRQEKQSFTELTNMIQND